MPRPDFPRTLFEFQRWFPDEAACVRFLIRSRWPDGFICPRCGFNEYYWLETRNLLQRKQCGHMASPTAGTVMHRSKQPPTLRFHAAYLVTTLTPGMSAFQFQRQVGFHNYETAFTMLHQLRASMVRPGRDQLSGLVEVDDTYAGGERPGKPGRGAEGNAIVVGAVDLRGNSVTRVRLMVIPNVTGETLAEFIKHNVLEGSTIRTDDWSGYRHLDEAGCRHVIAECEMLHTHRVFSSLKTWLQGTRHGAVRPQHLQTYLNEYTFRFNRRDTQMAAFQTVLGLAKERIGPSYDQLYGIAKGQSLYAHPANPRE